MVEESRFEHEFAILESGQIDRPKSTRLKPVSTIRLGVFMDWGSPGRASFGP